MSPAFISEAKDNKSWPFLPRGKAILIFGYWPDVIVIFVVDVDVPNVDVVGDVVVDVISIESMYFSKIMKASFYSIYIMYIPNSLFNNKTFQEMLL